MIRKLNMHGTNDHNIIFDGVHDPIIILQISSRPSSSLAYCDHAYGSPLYLPTMDFEVMED
jgi:hypothetical protein